MSRSLERLFKPMVSDPQLPAEVQVQIYEYATRHKCADLLASLAANENLIPELDRALAASTSAPVIAAWLSRPGRSRDEINSRLTKRMSVAVRCALAAQPGLAVADYLLILEPRNQSVCLAILTNMSDTATAHEVQHRAAQYLTACIETATDPYRQMIMFTRHFAERPDLHETVLRYTTSPILASKVREETPVTDATVLRLVEEVLLPTLRTPASKRWCASELYHGPASCALEVISTLAGASRFDVRSTARLIDALSDMQVQCDESDREKVEARVGAIMRPLYRDTHYSHVRTCTDPVELLEHAKSLEWAKDRHLARTIACNRAAGVDAVRLAIPHMFPNDMHAVAAARVDDLDVYGLLLSWRFGGITDEEFAVASDPEAIMVDIIRRARMTPTYLGSSRFCTARVLSQLTLPIVTEFVRESEPARQVVFGMLKALGPDPWQVLETLVNDDQPFGELLQGAQLLCA